MIHRIEYILKEKIQRQTVEGLDYGTPAANKPTADEIRRYVEANRRKQGKAHLRNRQHAAQPAG
jgi:hypothetical protein